MAKSAHVLRRTPESNEWNETEYPVGSKGFDYRTLQKMTGGGLYEAVRLDETFDIIWDEEGRLKELPVSAKLGLADGTELPIFGPFAIVRTGVSRTDANFRIYEGLRPGDAEVIRSKFPWRDARG